MIAITITAEAYEAIGAMSRAVDRLGEMGPAESYSDVILREGDAMIEEKWVPRREGREAKSRELPSKEIALFPRARLDAATPRRAQIEGPNGLVIDKQQIVS
jgi:hypothetical protein